MDCFLWFCFTHYSLFASAIGAAFSLSVDVAMDCVVVADIDCWSGGEGIASCGNYPDVCAMPKAHTKTASIEITCSPEEKEQLRQNATRAGTSVSRYLVTLGLNGNTADYGTLRRKADGALVNAELYQRLGEMVTALQASPDYSWSLVQETIDLIHELRREIALSRLRNFVERLEP